MIPNEHLSLWSRIQQFPLDDETAARQRLNGSGNPASPVPLFALEGNQTINGFAEGALLMGIFATARPLAGDGGLGADSGGSSCSSGGSSWSGGSSGGSSGCGGCSGN